MKAKHILIGGLALGGGLLLYRAAKAGKNLVIKSMAKISRLEAGHMILALDSVIQNPTGGSIRIKFPFVSMLLDSSLIASTDPVNLDIDIKPYSQVKLRDYLMQEKGLMFDLAIPYTAIMTLAPKVIALWSGTIEKFDVIIRTRTTAFIPGLPVNGMDISEDSIVPLKKPSF